MDAVKSIGRVFLKLAFFVLGGYLILTVPDVEWAGDGVANVIPLLGFAAGLLVWIGIWAGAMGVSTWRHWRQRNSGQWLDFCLHLAALFSILAIPAGCVGILFTQASPHSQYAEYNQLMVLILLFTLLASAGIGAGTAVFSGFLLKRFRS